MRATLLRVLFSIRSERQLVEQISYNLLFRGFGACRSTVLTASGRIRCRHRVGEALLRGT